MVSDPAEPGSLAVLFLFFVFKFHAQPFMNTMNTRFWFICPELVSITCTQKADTVGTQAADGMRDL